MPATTPTRTTSDRTPHTLSGARRRARRAGATVAVLLALVGTTAACTAARGDTPEPDATVDAAPSGDPRVQAALDSLVDDEGFPGVLAHVVDADGVAHDYTSGVGDLATGAEIPVDGAVRIASNTKSFTAAVVLQLVGEGLVDLDAPVETYLPGLVRGEGIDGNAITVRQLLQHTSGLPNYTAYMDFGSLDHLGRYVQQRHHTDVAFAHEATSAPGEEWGYSNTNYTVLGLLVEAVTGRPFAEQVTERVIDRLGLEDTYVPGPGERELRAPHPRGYLPDGEGDVVDVTELDPSWAGPAGDIVSTPSDLLAFFHGLVDGRLLEPAELEALGELVDMPEEYPGDGYGLGVIRTTLSCGTVLWGHGGDIEGYTTRGGVTADGQGVVYAATSLATTMETHYAMEDTVDEIVCGS